MAKPIINPLNAFSYEDDYTVSFFWGGNQIKSVRLVVASAITGVAIYDNTIETYKYEYTIPANSLALVGSNLGYTMQIAVTDINGEVSSLSDKVFVYILTKPTFEFTNVTAEQEIENSSFTAIIKYDQIEWEDLKEYQFYLYDSTCTLIKKSDVLYDIDDISYTYNALECKTYYIRCYGQTVHGFKVDTGKICIHVNYKQPSAYSTFYVENDKNHGYITYKTNIIVIKYNGDKEFAYDNGKIDLRKNSLEYDSGFSIDDDMVLCVKGIDMFHSGLVLKCKNDTNSLTVTGYIYDDDNLRYKLEVNNGVDSYVLYSDALSFTNYDTIFIWIKRIGNLYKMNVFVDFGTVPYSDLYFYESRPKNTNDLSSWIMDEKNIKVNAEDITTVIQSDEPETPADNSIWILDTDDATEGGTE